LLQIVEYPSELLIKHCSPVKEFDDRLRVLVDEMYETMYTLNGIGLAASQVGVLETIVVIDSSAGDKSGEQVTMINPHVMWLSGDTTLGEEGCLSLPGVFLNVLRSCEITVEFNDVYGNASIVKYDGLMARIVQHEIDHLYGIMLFDHVGTLIRKDVKKRSLKGKVV
jgi:peptide deformylase